MSKTIFSITANDLARRVGHPDAPQIIDVRKRETFDDADCLIASACWRDHREAGRWAAELDSDREVVVYCVHGYHVGRAAAALLRGAGLNARFLEGGIDGFVDRGGLTISREVCDRRWIANSVVGTQTLSCAWLIRRFFDPAAQILFTDAEWFAEVAMEVDATETTDFKLLLALSGLDDPALERMAEIIDAASDDDPIGLPALSAGLGALYRAPEVVVEKGLGIYDALYARACISCGRIPVPAEVAA